MFEPKCTVDGCEEKPRHQHELKPFVKIIVCHRHNRQVRKLIDELSVEATKQHIALKNKYLDKIENLK